MAIPLGWICSFPIGMGVYGMWWGITIGLALTAIILGSRLWRKTSDRHFTDYKKRGAVA
jgi:Na+-driven multidrug efflux pump